MSVAKFQLLGLARTDGVKFRDILAYKERRDAQGREILNELTRLGQKSGDCVPLD